MKLIIGLGNPGEDYINTRHNTGLLVAKILAKKGDTSQKILESDVFMNDSGTFVKKMVDYYKVPLDLVYIVHDDLDLPLGSYKIQFGVGPKDHNGLIDIEKKLGTDQFWRIRVGIDNRDKDKRPSGEDYVLERFSANERIVIDRVAEEIAGADL